MREKGPVVLLGAMDGEIESFLKSLTINEKIVWNGFTIYRGIYGQSDLIIAKTGVGKVLSAIITQKIIDDYSPSAIICTGIAGSLNKEIGIGDILVGSDSVQHDFDATHFNFKIGEIPYTSYRFVKSDETLLNIALKYKLEGQKIVSGRVLTGDQFISGQMTNELDGDCVEMEGASIALVATINKIPHLIIRTISDKADGEKKVNLREFLKKSSENSLKMVQYILNNL
ncbi:MAG: 5'-methylthioadenosine/adenosylhomocysteine nucleosidase [Spirochaetaceae bacterium]|nr:5'-methylthioadenosine/adenosylhomocysteine nucleosidase [Spirochaetaceae bacterium]